MKWVELAITTNPLAGEAVASVLMEAGANGVHFQDPELLARQARSSNWDEVYDVADLQKDSPEYRVIAYYPRLRLEETLVRINAGLNRLRHYMDIGPGTITRSVVDEADWANAWKAFYHARPVGSFVVCPTWEKYEKKPGERVIYLDPGMAFGTGDHPTTALCLKALDKHVRAGNKVLDLGTGSGILAIAAAVLGGQVTALDIDPVAVSVARRNAALNGVESLVAVAEGTLESHQGQVDVLIANITLEVIKPLLPSIPKHLKPGGLFIGSGIIAARKKEIIEALQDQGFAVVEKDELEGWLVVTAVQAKGGDTNSTAQGYGHRL